MVSNQFKTSLVLLFLGFISGVCLSVLFMGCGGCNSSASKSSPLTEIKSKAADNHASYQNKDAQLDSIQSNLTCSIDNLKTPLKKAKQAVAKRQIRIARIIEPKGYPAKKLIKESDYPHPEVGFKCDSVINEVSLLIKENNYKDSLYETQLAQYDDLVHTQNLIIQNDSFAYQNLQGLFDEAIERGEILEKENSILRKKMKRQKVKGKLVSIGLIILSGFAANNLLHH